MNMELLATLSNINNLEKLKNSGVDGVIFGSKFSLRFNYSLDELKKISVYCHENRIKKYVSIDAFISEKQLDDLVEYLVFLKELRLDGIYFTDLGVFNLAKQVDMFKGLIFDPDTLITNSLDAAFFIKQDVGVVLARELTFKEIEEIVKRNPGEVDLQVFGYLKMSYSKRKFLTNYFKHIGEEKNFAGNKDLRIVEENRDYNLPIVEDDFGTRIYSDYCLLMYEELTKLRPYIKRAIVEDSFLDSNIIIDVVKDIRRLTGENAAFLKDSLINKYPNVTFSKGYLQQKTTKTKEEND